MTIFAVLMPTPQAGLAEVIKEVFPDDHLQINETQWLISSSATAVEVVAKLRIYDAKTPEAPSSGSAIVFAMASYFGRAPTTIWDWIRSKLEQMEAKPRA